MFWVQQQKWTLAAHLHSTSKYWASLEGELKNTEQVSTSKLSVSSFMYSLSWHKPLWLLKKHFRAPSPVSCSPPVRWHESLCNSPLTWIQTLSWGKRFLFPEISTAHFTTGPCKNPAGTRLEALQCQWEQDWPGSRGVWRLLLAAGVI